MQRESPLFPRPLFHPVPENAFSLSLSLSLCLCVYVYATYIRDLDVGELVGEVTRTR